MTPKLYVVHGSHPCAAVEKAAELKGIALKKVELPPPAHGAVLRALRFPERTVPALRIGAERLSGSSAILRRLEALAPEPPLLPADPAARTAVEEAERFDDDVLQRSARRILWTAFKRNPRAMPSFQEHSTLPVPGGVVVLNAPLITRVELKLNDGAEDKTRADLAALPGHLDRLDAWIAGGTLGGDPPNIADLKLAASVRLLSTLADLAPVFAERPCLALARRLYPVWDGRVPAGTLPEDWLPAAAAEKRRAEQAVVEGSIGAKH